MKDIIGFILTLLGFSLLVVAIQCFSLVMGALVALADLVSRKFFNKTLL